LQAALVPKAESPSDGSLLAVSDSPYSLLSS
jgi:hypothetical protein